jgi:hypothetical protein
MPRPHIPLLPPFPLNSQGLGRCVELPGHNHIRPAGGRPGAHSASGMLQQALQPLPASARPASAPRACHNPPPRPTRKPHPQTPPHPPAPQIGIAAMHLGRIGLDSTVLSAMVAAQCVFLYFRLNYFSRLFASRFSLVDSLKQVGVAWFEWAGPGWPGGGSSALRVPLPKPHPHPHPHPHPRRSSSTPAGTCCSCCSCPPKTPTPPHPTPPHPNPPGHRRHPLVPAVPVAHVVGLRLQLLHALPKRPAAGEGG